MTTQIQVPAAVSDQAKIAKLAAQYRSLFGVPPGPGAPDTRTEAQIAVWRDLEIAGYAKRPVFMADRAGALCGMRAAFADGRRSIFLYIESNVTFDPVVDPQQQQPKN